MPVLSAFIGVILINGFFRRWRMKAASNIPDITSPLNSSVVFSTKLNRRVSIYVFNSFNKGGKKPDIAALE